MEEGSHAVRCQEMEQLRQENASLKRELDTFRTQFTEVMKFADQVTDTENRNAELSENIRNMHAQVDDLKKRLEISLQSKVDLQESWDREKIQLQEELEQRILTAKSDSENQKQHLLNEIKELRKNNKDAEAQNEENGIRIHELEMELKQIYVSASEHFNESISGLESLILAFSTPVKSPEPIPETLHRQEEKDDAIPKLKAKNKALKNEIAKLKMSYESDVRKLSEASETKSNEASLRYAELECKCDRINKQLEEAKKAKEVLILENAKLNTKLKCCSAECESRMINDTVESRQQIKDLTMKVQTFEEKNETLKRQIQPLITKVRSLQDTVSELEQTTEEQQESIKTLMEDKIAISAELEDVKEERDSAKYELKEISQRVPELLNTAKEYKKTVNEQTIENKKLSGTIDNMTLEMNALKSDVETLRKEREEMEQVIEKQHEALRKMELASRDSKRIAEKTALDLDRAQQQLANASQPVNEVHLLPLAVDSVENFPEELGVMVKEITQNPTIRAPTMLKHIFTVINEWYVSRSRRIEDQLKEKSDSLFNTQNGIDCFLHNLSKIFTEVDCSFQDFEDTIKALETYMKKRNTETMSSHKEKGELEAQVLDLLIEIGADDATKAKSEVRSMKKTIDKCHDSIAELKSKSKTLQKLIKSKESHFSKETEKMNENAKLLTREIEKWKAAYSELQTEIVDVRAEKQSTIEHYESVIQDSTVHAEAQSRDYENRIEKLIDELRNAKFMTQKAEEAKMEAEREVSRLENTVQLLNSNQDKRSEDIERLKKKLVEVTDKAKQRIESERETNTKKSDKVIAEIQARLTELTVDNTKLKKSSTTLEAKCERLRAENDSLSLKLQACEMRAQALSNDFDREKRLMASQMKMQLLAKDNEFHQKLEECRLKLHEAKRGLMGFVANSFCTLFNVNNSLDDSNFETFVINIRTKFSELLSMEANLRELLCLGPKQSIEDCVSSMLLSQNTCL